jgi:hypothetical protein
MRRMTLVLAVALLPGGPLVAQTLPSNR